MTVERVKFDPEQTSRKEGPYAASLKALMSSIPVSVNVPAPQETLGTSQKLIESSSGTTPAGELIRYAREVLTGQEAKRPQRYFLETQESPPGKLEAREIIPALNFVHLMKLESKFAIRPQLLQDEIDRLRISLEASEEAAKMLHIIPEYSHLNVQDVFIVSFPTLQGTQTELWSCPPGKDLSIDSILELFRTFLRNCLKRMFSLEKKDFPSPLDYKAGLDEAIRKSSLLQASAIGATTDYLVPSVIFGITAARMKAVFPGHPIKKEGE